MCTWRTRIADPVSRGGWRVSALLAVFLASAVMLIAVAAPDAAASDKVVTEGDPVPPPIGGTFTNWAGIPPTFLGVNDAGDVLFWSAVKNGTSSGGVFLRSRGRITKIVADGDVLPAFGGTFIDQGPQRDSFSLNAAGQVAFVATVSTASGQKGGLFLSSPGAGTVKLVTEGDPAPEPAMIDPKTDPDVIITRAVGLRIHLNDNGVIAVITGQGKLVAGGRSAVSIGNLYLWSGGALSRIVDGGTMTAAGKIDLTGSGLGPIVNNRNQVALLTSTDRVREAVFLCTVGSCQKVVATGDAIPGGTWPMHTGPQGLVDFNDRGQILLLPGLSPGGEFLRWKGGGAFDVIVRSGVAAPPDVGGTIGSVGPAYGIPQWHLTNDLGDVALRLIVSGGTTTQAAMLSLPGGLRKVDAAGGAAPGGTFSSGGDFASNIGVNNPGCVVFQGSLAGVPSSGGLFATNASPVTKETALRYWADVDDHTLFAEQGRGDVLLRQLYGPGTPVELKEKVFKDITGPGKVFDVAAMALPIAIFEANGKAVPPGDAAALAAGIVGLKTSGILARLSRLQLELVRKHWNTCNGQIDFAKLLTATELFANGELRTGVEAGQREMDALYAWTRLVFFAQFAIDQGVDVTEWQEMLKIFFIGTQIYAKAYPGPVGPTPAQQFFGIFRASEAARFNAATQLKDADKATLRSAIQPLTPAEVRTKIKEFIDDVTIAQVSPPQRTVEFANVTSTPDATGFNVDVTVRVTDAGGTTVSNGTFVLLADEAGLSIPFDHLNLTLPLINQGGSGTYVASFHSPVPSGSYLGLFAYGVEDGPIATGDADRDQLPDAWETTFGLNPASALGADGANGDPDGDGRTNQQELQVGTHPRGFVTHYLAEGATGSFFDAVIALLNPGPTPASVLLRFLREDATTVSQQLTIPPRTRRTVIAEAQPGLESAAFSTVIESDALVIVDRTMTWGGGYGSHAETALLAPSTTWYLAEGTTGGNFQLFYLLQNPNAAPTTATIRFLRPAGAPIVRAYQLPPLSRTTIYVNDVDPVLAWTDVSAVFDATQRIIVERAQYMNRPGQPFAAGHGSAGVTAPALKWFLAEGATGSFFELFILLANPSPDPAVVEMRYLTSRADVFTKTLTLGPNSRTTIWVDQEQFTGLGRALADAAVSTLVTSLNGVPIVVERAMWWPDGNWYEAHNSAGATSTGARWALADGEVGGPSGVQTYVLIANTSPTAGTARVTLLFEDSASAERTYDLAANSRTNVPVGVDFPQADGKKFGVIVESLDNTPAQLVVERAMYSNAGGVVWAAGTNALGTRLP